MTHILGSIHRSNDSTGVVHIEDVYDTDIADLWSALTTPERLARWMAQVEGDLKTGGAFRAAFTSSWEGTGRIDVCDAPKRLLVTLNPGTADENTIEATLTAEGRKTRLVIEEHGLPLDDIHLHGAGWQAHIEDLQRHLGGGESHWKQRWEELTPSYAAMPIS